jgi:hypothetical protein
MLRASLRPSVVRLAMPPKRKAGAAAAAAPAKAAKADAAPAAASGDAAVSIEACKS